MNRMIALAFLFLCACDRQEAARVPPPTAAPAASARPTVVFLGDSLTAGLGLPESKAYPSLIQARLSSEGRPWKVVNAGVSGDTTAGGLARLDWLYRQKVEVLVVALGANDGLRGLPLKDTEANLRAILGRGRREGSRLVLVGMQLPENLGPDYRRGFSALFPRLAQESGATFIPFLLEGVALDPALNQADGIHPNEAGARRVAETIWKGREQQRLRG
jgi:acyl-CoA thioesterase-1